MILVSYEGFLRTLGAIYESKEFDGKVVREEFAQVSQSLDLSQWKILAEKVVDLIQRLEVFQGETAQAIELEKELRLDEQVVKAQIVEKKKAIKGKQLTLEDCKLLASFTSGNFHKLVNTDAETVARNLKTAIEDDMTATMDLRDLETELARLQDPFYVSEREKINQLAKKKIQFLRELQADCQMQMTLKLV